MKKIIYIILISLVSNLAFSSCTEEKVEPTAAPSKVISGGGSDDKP